MLTRWLNDKMRDAGPSPFSKPYMVESVAVWWADLSSITTALIATGAVALLSDGWQRAPTAITTLVAFLALVEAINLPPWEYETSSRLQRWIGHLRRRMNQQPPEVPRARPATVLGVLTAILGGLLALAS